MMAQPAEIKGEDQRSQSKQASLSQFIMMDVSELTQRWFWDSLSNLMQQT